MKIRKLFFLAIIAVILSMFIACEDKDPVTSGSDEYTVRFEANGGYPVPQNQTVSSGGYITEPAPMTRTGYVFGGWYKETAFINQWNFYSDTVTDNITLYAKWVNYYTNYTVKFEANGGSPAPEDQSSIIYGGKATEPAPMTKTGYGFAGWYKEAAFINLWDFDNDTVTDNTTLYAKWDSNYHTVNFDADGGNPVPQQQNIVHSYKVNIPQDISKAGYVFEGWYKEAAFNNLWNFNSDTVTENIVLYAKWEYIVPTTVQGTTLAEKLQWLNSNAESNSTYILEVNSDEYLNPQTLSYNGKSNIAIQLIGIGGVKTIELYGFGSLFTVDGVTLILNENIVLKGLSDNNAPLINVDSGNLILNNGSKITGNRNRYSYPSYGGGVYISDGTFTMNGGEISDNTAYYYSSSYGGGVYISNGTFTMNGGEISGNTASASSNAYSYGGGVYISNGTFTMTGGEISGNIASSGGGVLVNGTFTMAGGEISGNTASSSSGGVSVNGTFTMTGGEISGNIASASASSSAYSYGGGVSVSGTFIMTGGEISGNTASASASSSAYSYGGGVYISNGTFTMTGGEISGNTASSSSSNTSISYGGGVYVSESTIEKTGGIITGHSSDAVNGNVLKENDYIIDNYYGHAVYVEGQLSRRKETTAGQWDNLIYIRNEPNPPTISGAWDTD
jgi:uncharacterized repeat protein (TIGR02543 family)